MNKEVIASFEFNNEKLLQTLKETSSAVEALKFQQKQLTAQGEMSSQQFIENKARLKELNTEMSEGLKILNNRNKSHRIDIENYEREGKSIRELRKDSQDLIKVRNEMILNGEKSTATFKKINEIIDENTDIIKKNVSAHEQQKMNIGNYSEGIVDAWEKIKSGDVKGAVNQVGELGAAWRESAFSAKGAWKEIMAIPVAGWIMGVTAVLVMGFNEMLKYNNSIFENVKKLDNLGIDQKVRPQIEALADTFKVSFDQISGTIDNLLDLNLVKDAAEAVEYLKMGLVSAPDSNDFLAEIESTAQTAQRLGMDLSNIINIKRDIEAGGLDSSKIFGGMETSISRILGQAEKIKPILNSTFGPEFTSQLYKGVTDKTIQYGDALNMIYKKGEELKISDQERADIAKALFGKSSASAFDYNETLGLISKSYRSLDSGLTDLQKATLRQANEYEKMKIAKDEALKSDSIVAFRQEFEVAKVKIQTLWYNLIATFRDADRAVQGSAAFVRGVFMSIPKAAATAFAGVLSALAEMVNGFRSGGRAISLFFKGEFEEAGKEFGKFTASIPLMMARIKNSFNGFASDLGTGGSAEAKKSLNVYDARSKANAEVYRANNPENGQRDTPEQPGKPTKSKADKLKNTEAEKESERLRKIAEVNAKASVDLMKYELDEYIKSNQSKIDSEAFVTQQVLKIDQERSAEILRRKKAHLEAEKALELSNKELTEAQKEVIFKKYESERAALEAEVEAERVKNEAIYADQKAEREKFARLVEHETKIRQMEKDFESEWNLKQEQLDFEYEQNEERKALQKELDLIEAETADAEVLDRKVALEAALLNIEAEFSASKKEINRAEQDARLESYAAIAGGIAEIAGKETVVGKAAAVAQAGINTYRGVSAVLADEDLPTVAKPFFIASAIATGVATVAKIAGINISGVQGGFASIASSVKSLSNSGKKAEKGILLNGPSHAAGGLDLFDQYGNHLVNAEGGEMLAVVNKKSTMNYLSDLNVAGGGIPLTNYVTRAESGGMINTAISTTNADESKQLAEAIYQATLNGTYKGSQKGMKDLSSDRQIQLDARY